MATNLKPFCSNRFIISAINPRLTPSGLTIMKDLSELMILVEIYKMNRIVIFKPRCLRPQERKIEEVPALYICTPCFQIPL